MLMTCYTDEPPHLLYTCEYNDILLSYTTIYLLVTVQSILLRSFYTAVAVGSHGRRVPRRRPHNKTEPEASPLQRGTHTRRAARTNMQLDRSCVD